MWTCWCSSTARGYKSSHTSESLIIKNGAVAISERWSMTSESACISASESLIITSPVRVRSKTFRSVCDEKSAMVVSLVWRTAWFPIGQCCAKHMCELHKRRSKLLCKNPYALGMIGQKTLHITSFSKTTALYTTYRMNFCTGLALLTRSSNVSRLNCSPFRGVTAYTVLNTCTPVRVRSYCSCWLPTLLISFPALLTCSDVLDV